MWLRGQLGVSSMCGEDTGPHRPERRDVCRPMGVTPAQGHAHPGNKILLKGPMALGPRRLMCEGVSLSGGQSGAGGVGKRHQRGEWRPLPALADQPGERLAHPLCPQAVVWELYFA